MRFLIAILFCWSCVAATITTKTVKESGGDYTTLSAWEAGRQADLTASDTIELASIEGSWTTDDTSSFSINSWTTDATRYICITNSTSKHDGKRYGSAASAYRITSATSIITINEDYVRIYGLQMKLTASTSAQSCINTASVGAGDVRIGYCILYFSGSGSSAGGIWNGDADITPVVFNTICYGFNQSFGTFIYASSGPVTAYNCTSFDNTYGFRNYGSTITTYNCIHQGGTDGWYGTVAGDFNITTDGSSDDPPGSNPSDQTLNVAFVSESAGAEDFHLGSTQPSGVLDSTSDQSSGLFSNDIDYVTRSGSWDIGADEYVAAATSSGQIIIIRQQ